jgi:hypothetical protein
VPTGFDEGLFAGSTILPHRKLTVLHAGTHFYEGWRHGKNFLRAIDEWVEANPRAAADTEFVFIGERYDGLAQAHAAMAHPEVVRLEPFVTHRACIGEIEAAHVCIVNTVGNRIPDKVYECMRAGKKILGLTDPGSDLTRMLTAYPGGIAVAPSDVAGIRRAFDTVSHDPAVRAGADAGASAYAARYASTRSAITMASIFERVLASESAKRAAAGGLVKTPGA